eukprot:m.900324 g.900324  ORF g.900324 m.900324 type:complete len:291 (+) comp23685_c0_seq5:152-1024(+)
MGVDDTRINDFSRSKIASTVGRKSVLTFDCGRVYTCTVATNSFAGFGTIILMEQVARLQFYSGIKIFLRCITGWKAWCVLALLAIFQAGSLYFHKRASMAVKHYPYVLALTQPMFTSTLFGLCCLLRWLISDDTPKSDMHTADDANDAMAKQRLINDDTDDTDDDTLYNRRFEYRRPGRLIGWTGRCSEMTWHSWRNMATIGFLLTCHNFMKFAGSRGELVSGPLVVLLEQAVVPVSMVVSMVLLGSRYQLSHAAGAALVITGIAASTVPTLVHASGSKVWAAVLVLGGE